MPPALPSLFPFSPVLCSIWVPCRAAPGFAHSTEPCRASHGCSQLAAFMSELTNLPQGIKQKLGSPCSPCTPQRGCWTLPRGFLRAHGCMEQPSVILNHGSENPLWLSPSALQRDDKLASSVIAFFLSFPPLCTPQPCGCSPATPAHSASLARCPCSLQTGFLSPTVAQHPEQKCTFPVGCIWGPPPNWQQRQDLHRRAEKNMLAGATVTPNPTHWYLHEFLLCPSLETLRCVWLLRTFPGVSCSPLHSHEPLASVMASCP